MTTSTHDIPQRLRLIACLALVMAPHLTRVPLWVSLFVAVILAWQVLTALRQWPPASRWLRLGLAALTFAGVYANFGRVNGQEAGVALLMVMLALKLTETHRHRDTMVLLGLCYFVLVTHFLFSQSIAMAGFLGVAAWLITACFLDANHPQGALPWRTALRSAGALVVQAIPVAALLFVLFPRIPGPLWGLPSDSGASARTGLSDSMEPGLISSLALSDAVAFRVRFQGDPPPADKLYWRGPVLWEFDGRKWSVGKATQGSPAPRLEHGQGQRITYQVTIEPHRHRWLLALDMPAQGPRGSQRNAAGELLSEKPIKERRLYRASSYLDYQLQIKPRPALLYYARQLPADGNPETRALARQWRKQGLSQTQIVNTALKRFREQPFHYTLRPPPLPGRDAIDDFLFDTRAGFCEHYAGAFTFLMRAAGIPARVVTGYQGGEINNLGGYMIVRSADAHAWSEVWLSGRGWVRIDPTSAVAPERIESGVSAALGADEPVPYMARHGDQLLYRLQLRWDWINASWNRWFLAYGPELQNSFLSRLGLPDWRAMILALTALLTVFLALLGFALVWQARPRAKADAVQAAWLKFCQRCARSGLPRAVNEGPQAYAQRIIEAHPEWQAPVQRITALYIQLRYGKWPANSQNIQRLRRAVAQFRLRSTPA